MQKFVAIFLRSVGAISSGPFPPTTQAANLRQTERQTCWWADRHWFLPKAGNVSPVLYCFRQKARQEREANNSRVGGAFLAVRAATTKPYTEAHPQWPHLAAGPDTLVRSRKRLQGKTAL
ncbi:hypothetical protein MOSE0_J08416 [Monosporozyma servazzii]